MFDLKTFNSGSRNFPGTLRLLRDEPTEDPLGIGSYLTQQPEPELNTEEVNRQVPNTQTSTSPITTETNAFSESAINAVGSTLKGIKRVGQEPTSIAPLSIVGEGLGVSLTTSKLGESMGLNDMDKEQETVMNNMRFMQDQAIDELKEARNTGNTEQEERMKKLLNHMSETDYNLYDDALKDAPPTSQIVTDAVTSALAAFGVSGAFGKLGKVDGRVAKVFDNLAQSQKISSIGGKVGDFTRNVIRGTGEKIVPYAKEAVIGSALDAYLTAHRDDADTQDIVNAAERGLLLGPSIMATFGLTGKVLSKSKEALSPQVKNAISHMEEWSRKTLKKKPKDSTVKEEILSTIGRTTGLKAAGASSFLKTVESARQFKTRVYDRFNPFKRFEENLQEVVGRPLKDEEAVYRDFRMFKDTTAVEADKAMSRFANTMRPYDDIADEYTAYVAQLDYIDRAKLGNKVPNNKDLDTLKDELRLLVEEIGDDMPRVAEARNQIQTTTREMLQDRLNSGLISRDEYNRIIKEHPNYIPHNVVRDGTENAASILSQSMDVTENTLKKAVGSSRNIDDPIVGIGQQMLVSKRGAEKNRILNNFIKANDEENIVTGMKKLKSGQKPDDGFGQISLFQDGKKVKYQVPKDIELSVKGPESGGGNILSNGLFKMAKGAADLLRSGATTYNPGFFGPNKLRDEQTSAVVSHAFIQDLKKRYGVQHSDEFVKNLDSKTLNKMYDEHGIFGSDIFKDGQEWIDSRMESSGLVEVIRDKNPLTTVKKVNEALERSSRMEAFRKSLNEGLDPKSAAIVARDVTIDFSKMGTDMKQLNQVIPFLNARLQSFANMLRAGKLDPEGFARVQLRLGGYPTMVLENHNNQFESYQHISDREKDQNWIIQVGEMPARDNYSGEEFMAPQIVKIPKSPAQMLAANPLRWALDSFKGNNYRKFSEMMLDTVGQASPVPSQSFGEGNTAMSAISQLGPLPSAVVGVGTNIHPYFGNEIIPQDRKNLDKDLQFGRNTPETSKKIGNILNVSPAQVNFVIESFGAGLSSIAQDGIDMIFGLYNGELSDDIKEKAQTDSLFGRASGLPIVDKFLAEPSEFFGPQSEFRRKRTNEIRKKIESREARKGDDIEEMFNKMNSMEKKEDRVNYIKSLDLSDEEYDDFARLKQSRQTLDGVGKNSRVELRGRVIFQAIEEMKNSGVSKTERIRYIEEMQEKGILTNQVYDVVDALKREADLRYQGAEQRPSQREEIGRFLPGTRTKDVSR